MDRSITILNVSELSRVLTTRGRGTEAYHEFASHFKEGPVALDLDDAEVISASFLDGLLLRLIEDKLLNSVSFKTSNPRFYTRLQRISADRQVDIHRYRDGCVEKIEPLQAPKLLRSKFSGIKPVKPIPTLKES